MKRKCCNKCERLLPVKEFSKDRRAKDGLQSWCRQCAADYQAVYQAVYREKHPLKAKCRQQLNNAIAAGKIKRQPCMNGCEGKAEGHHRDYTKPFDVDWLCPECHRAWHKNPINKQFFMLINTMTESLLFLNAA